MSINNNKKIKEIYSSLNLKKKDKIVLCIFLIVILFLIIFIGYNFILEKKYISIVFVVILISIFLISLYYKVLDDYKFDYKKNQKRIAGFNEKRNPKWFAFIEYLINGIICGALLKPVYYIFFCIALSCLIYFSINIEIGNLILLITFLGLLWYANETMISKQVQQKELIEIRKQTEFSIRPYLRLQWKDRRSCIHLFNYLKDIGDPPMVTARKIDNELNKFTSLELINDGKGLATNINIIKCQLKSKEIKLKNIPVISVGGNTQLEYANQVDEDLNKVNRDQYIEIIIEYKDITKDVYQVRFRSKINSNDGFRIVYQDKIHKLIEQNIEI